ASGRRHASAQRARFEFIPNGIGDAIVLHAVGEWIHGRTPSRAAKTTTPARTEASMPARKQPSDKSAGAEPKLLSGGNPQIPKGEGNEPVQAYIAAMPEWKWPVGERLDQLIEKTVPDVRKAVKWNQPFYGSGDDGGY